MVRASHVTPLFHSWGGYVTWASYNMLTVLGYGGEYVIWASYGTEGLLRWAIFGAVLGCL